MIRLGKDICFLIITHSGNLDVLKGLELNFLRHGFSIQNGYVLFNDNIERSPIEGFKPIIVEKGDWISEIREGLACLKKLGYTKVVLWLDDFYLTKPVNVSGFERAVNISTHYLYLGLKRQRNSFLHKRNCLHGICEFNEKFKYYSSLQVALWDIGHFLEILLKSKNIWDFELQKIEGSSHYEVKNSVVSYLHSVEKGRWKYYSKFFFNKELKFSKNSKIVRQFEKRFINIMIVDIMRILKVRIFGY